MSENKHQNIGSSLDDFLAAEGTLEQFQNTAIKEVLAWQITQEMERLKISKTEMAKQMKTSRAQLDRLLDPENESVTLNTLQKAALVLGRKIKLELV